MNRFAWLNVHRRQNHRFILTQASEEALPAPDQPLAGEEEPEEAQDPPGIPDVEQYGPLEAQRTVLRAQLLEEIGKAADVHGAALRDVGQILQQLRVRVRRPQLALLHLDDEMRRVL